MACLVHNLLFPFTNYMTRICNIMVKYMCYVPKDLSWSCHWWFWFATWLWNLWLLFQVSWNEWLSILLHSISNNLSLLGLKTIQDNFIPYWNITVLQWREITPLRQENVAKRASIYFYGASWHSSLRVAVLQFYFTPLLCNKKLKGSQIFTMLFKSSWAPPSLSHIKPFWVYWLL